ncbi:DUF58 domain-containing protein [Amphritea balenae]|uniref:DUF58 domain-containing protein n=1 Tax=Amphritea balenae TaxID=452629 RepID=A0A3P1SVF6_9GAMM|nr:DUF58 domain-containing protein [Amphritea balenae]RRD00546.1 DUF58 domain-containing protein [Amphritea balenae]GGK69836.1 membrane protein [Amphritea balenae]
MIPSIRALGIVAVLLGLSLLTIWWPELYLLRDLCAAVIVAASLLDILLVRREPMVEVSRELRGSVPVGVWSEVKLQVTNAGGRPQWLTLHDHHPAEYATEGLPQHITVPAERSARLTYKVRPDSRGDGHFNGVDLVSVSPLGLWQRKRFVSLPQTVKVYPNFRAISQYTLLATDHQLSQLGVKHRLRRGEGNDFHQLRGYRAGDSLRQIDWKATSRYHKLISKEYQDERDQQILFMLDCGRRMRHSEAEGGHLDQALNAMLLLAYVAAEQGDAVGFHTFGGEQRWFPPAKGGSVVRQMIAGTYDIEATLEAADYLEAARQLMPLQRRRALIVIVTNTRDEDSDDLVTAVRLLSRRHLVVVADLREEILDRCQAERVGDLDSALRFHGLQEYLESRARHHDLLRHQGAVTMDLLAKQLLVALVNQYFTVKASGRL